MDVLIRNSFLEGEITPPASKSYLHRALFAASLADSVTVIKSYTLSDDVFDTINALRSVGTIIDIGEDIVVTPSKYKKKKIEITESGTTYRLLIPILASKYKSFDISVSKTLYKRPLDTFKDLGLSRKGAKHQFKLSPGTFDIDGSISSQFVSGLIFALPLLNGNSIINLKNTTSSNYIEMTLSVVKEFGIEVVKKGNSILIKGNQTYIGTTYEVEPDFSSIAFWGAAGFINGNIKISAPSNSLQPDFKMIEILNDLGTVEYDNGFVFKKQTFKGFDLDVNDSPDIAPILSLLACGGSSKSILSGVERLVYKESDRIQGIISTLISLGVEIEYNGNIEVSPSSLTYGEINQSDHRIAMMASIASTTTDVRINNIETINKSYPNFIKDLESLGAIVEVLE